MHEEEWKGTLEHTQFPHRNSACSSWIPYWLKCKTRFFPKISHINMWGHLKFAYAASNRTASNQIIPNQITLNQTMQNLMKACTAKSSCEICAHMRYYAAQRGTSLPTFWENLSVPSQRDKKSERENTARLKLPDPIFFLGVLSIT
jgi:hypothetical protein